MESRTVSQEVPGPAGPLGSQTIRTVGARELRHQTADVIQAVRPGERTILTRHGRPQAVMLGVKDAIELLAQPRLGPLVAAAEAGFREGRVEPVEPAGPHPLLLSPEAAGAYERMNPRDRKDLRRALVRGLADEERLLWLRSGRWLALFSYPDAEAVLVCAAFEVCVLERELIGEELWLAAERRDLERRMHARDLGSLPR